MSDKIFVFSKRPAKVKHIHSIVYENRKLPLENRSSKEFNKYYSAIWKEIDANDEWWTFKIFEK